jgi:hypothetical protein
MPFTISHAAAILPLLRFRRLDPLALVVGSMAPDFGYFLQRFGAAAAAHSYKGSLQIALPSAALAWLLCRLAARFLTRPLPAHFSQSIQAFLRERPWSISSPFWIPVSLLLGIWSHTFLDAFTHEHGWFVRHIPALQWPVYHSLQHLGSIVGVLVLFFVLRHQAGALPSVRTLANDRNLRMLAVIALLAVAVASVMAASFASRFDGFLQVRAYTFHLVVHSIALFAVAYLVLAASLSLRAWYHRLRSA